MSHLSLRDIAKKMRDIDFVMLSTKRNGDGAIADQCFLTGTNVPQIGEGEVG